MANVIKHKRGSGSDPGASDLVVGEVAIRTDVGKLFTKMDNGSVAEIAGGGSDIAINTLSSSSATGGGSATFNGSAYRFTLSAPPSVSAQQLLVSINGVIQKPVAGTGQPSEGFSVSGNDIILGDAPATGADFFILTFKSLGVSEPADNSVTSAKIADGAIATADIADDAITTAKIAGTAITQAEIANGAVGQNQLASGAVITGRISDGAVTSAKIADGAIVNADINASAAIAKTKIETFVNNNGTTRLITGTNNVNELDAESNLTVNGSTITFAESTLSVTKSTLATVSAKETTGNKEIALRANTTGGVLRTIGSYPLIFEIAQVEKLRIDSSGRVGIGTTSPATRLHIEDTTPDLRIKSTNSNLGQSDEVGRISIHTSDPTTPTGVGEVFRIKSFSANANGADYSTELTSRAGSGGGESAIRLGQGAVGAIAFRTNTSGGATERMRIDSSGRVGIGVTSPSLNLDVLGTGVIGRFKSTNNNYVLALQGNNASQQSFIGTTSSGDMTFATGSGVSERIRIREGGGLTFNGDTAAANALSDYEEGYWSPTAIDGQALTLTGSGDVPSRRYIKIGRQVTCWFDITWSSSNSSPNFATRFSGLPFSVETGGHEAAAAVCIGFFDGSETDMLVAHISGGLVKFFENGDGMYSYSESAGDRIAGFLTYTTT